MLLVCIETRIGTLFLPARLPEGKHDMVEDMVGVTWWEALGSTSESDVSMAGVVNMVGMKIRAFCRKDKSLRI
jgi:hypothetical protein